MSRSVIPDICLNVTTLQALALEYLVALYPFVLIMFSYFTIELYDRNLTLIVAAWKLFRKVLTIFRRSWDIRTSVIDSFATFFLLSYVKVLSVTTDLLVPTQIYQLGSNRSKFGLYYSPSVTYFGNDHLPYAIPATVIFTLFVSIPTVTLVLYPYRFFQTILLSSPFNWHFLRAFVDSFQGCYKDGTEPGTFDCTSIATASCVCVCVCVCMCVCVCVCVCVCHHKDNKIPLDNTTVSPHDMPTDLLVLENDLCMFEQLLGPSAICYMGIYCAQL